MKLLKEWVIEDTTAGTYHVTKHITHILDM